MVNHVRTWLGNLQPLSAMTAGDEFIEPHFVPTPDSSMTRELRNVRIALFGHLPTRGAVNVRLAVYMAVIHHSYLAADAVATDSRLTYLPDGSDIFGSDISEEDLQHDVMAALTELEFLNSNSSTFFSGLNSYRDAWYQINNPLNRLAAVLLTTAKLTESAGVLD